MMPGPPRCWTPCAIGGKGDLDDLVAILEAERILQQVVVHEEPCDTLEDIVDVSERDAQSWPNKEDTRSPWKCEVQPHARTR